MIFLGGILLGIGYVLDTLLVIALFLVLARVVISWLNADPFNQVVRFVISATDPMLRPFKRIVPPLGQFDLTPLLLGLLFYFLRMALAGPLMIYGARLQAGLY